MHGISQCFAVHRNFAFTLLAIAVILCYELYPRTITDSESATAIVYNDNHKFFKLDSRGWFLSLTEKLNHGFFSMYNNALSGYQLSVINNVSCYFVITNEMHPFSWAFRRFLVEPFHDPKLPLYLWRQGNGSMVLDGWNKSLAQFIVAELLNQTEAANWTAPAIYRRPYSVFSRWEFENFSMMRDQWKTMENNIGSEKAFKMKSQLAQKLWKPQIEFARVAKAMRKALTKPFMASRFIAVHLRKGDKIVEAAEKPNSAYLHAIGQIIEKNSDIYRTKSETKTVSIFVMSDDDNAADGLISELWKINNTLNLNVTITGFKWIDLARNVYKENSESFEAMDIKLDEAVYVHEKLTSAGYNQNDLWNKISEIRKNNTDAIHYVIHELISSVTLAALSEHFVCTFSSNVARFIALLIGDLSKSFSLDDKWNGS